MIDEMTEVLGPEAKERITWDSDPVIEKIVKGWRAYCKQLNGQRLGFKTDQSFDDTVRWFLEDDIRR